jgi:hypothetical protein
MVITTEYAVGRIQVGPVSTYHGESYARFGIYAAERSPEEKPVAIGVQEVPGPGCVEFLWARTMLRWSFADSKDVSASAQMGRSIAAKSRGIQEPEMFRHFLSKQVKHSEDTFITLGRNTWKMGIYATMRPSRDLSSISGPLESDSGSRGSEEISCFLESRDYRIVNQGDNSIVIAEKDDFILAFASRSYFGGVLNVKSRSRQADRNND